jgi:hypothetical protein
MNTIAITEDQLAQVIRHTPLGHGFDGSPDREEIPGMSAGLASTLFRMLAELPRGTEPRSVTEALAEVDAEAARYEAAGYHGTDEYVDVLERLVSAVRAELSQPSDVAELAAQAERDARTMAPPVPGVTRHNGYIMRAVINRNPKVPGYLEAWWVAGEDPVTRHWVTWNAYAGDPAGSRPGRLSYDGGHYFDGPDAQANKRRAMGDLAERAGTMPEMARRIAAEVTRYHPEHGPYTAGQQADRRMASRLRKWAGQ